MVNAALGGAVSQSGPGVGGDAAVDGVTFAAATEIGGSKPPETGDGVTFAAATEIEGSEPALGGGEGGEWMEVYLRGEGRGEGGWEVWGVHVWGEAAYDASAYPSNSRRALPALAVHLKGESGEVLAELEWPGGRGFAFLDLGRPLPLRAVASVRLVSVGGGGTLRIGEVEVLAGNSGGNSGGGGGGVQACAADFFGGRLVPRL